MTPEYNLHLILPFSETMDLIWYCIPRVNEQIKIGEKLYSVCNVVHDIEKNSTAKGIIVHLLNF